MSQQKFLASDRFFIVDTKFTCKEDNQLFIPAALEIF